MLESIEKFYKYFGPKMNDVVFLDKSENIIEKYPDLPKNSQFYSSLTGESDYYSPDLIHILLSRDDYIDNLLQVLQNSKLNYVELRGFVSDMRAQTFETMRKSSLIKFIINEKKYFTPAELKRARRILDFAEKNFDPLVLLEDTSQYSCLMGNKTVSFPISSLASLFFNNYARVYNNDYGFLPSEVQPHEFMYCALQWARLTGVFEKYPMSNESEHFMYALAHDAFFDFSTVNLLNETKDEFTLNAQIDHDLVSYATKNMPKKFTKFQKNVLAYIRLCSYFHYDAGFYASNQKGRSAEFHSNIEHLKDITMSNASIVCYEFPPIFGRALNKLGTNYEFHNLYSTYGGGHANLKFKTDGYLVQAEPLYSIFDSDFIKTRLEHRIDGLTCLNENRATQARFKSEVDQVVDYFFKNEYKFDPIAGHWEQLKNEYSQLCEEKTKLSLSDKIGLLRQQIPDILLLPGLVRTIYTKKVCDCIFDAERREGRFEHTIVAEKVDYPDTEYMPVSIFSIVSKTQPENAKYLKIDFKDNVSHISKTDLQKGFDSGKYMRMSDSHSIPGIVVSEKESSDDE